MFFKSKIVNNIFGIIMTVLIYVSATFVMLILAKSYSTPARPIVQTVTNVRTFRYPDGSLDLKYNVHYEVIPEEVTISLIRAYYNLDTGEAYLLPHQLLHAKQGVHDIKFINPLPKNMAPGDYIYARSYDFMPPLGMVSKNFEYEHIDFRVCKDKGECIQTK